jgi:hypothetical protein
MRLWYMLAGNEPDKLKRAFNDFYSSRGFPRGTALWKWKNSYWICSPKEKKQEILNTFANYRTVEFVSAPSPSDIEFVDGDQNALVSS